MEGRDRLRRARVARGLRQQDLADALGVSATAVLMCEKPRYQRSVPVRFRKKISEILDIDEADLVDQDTPAPAEMSKPKHPRPSPKEHGLMTTDKVETQLLKLFRLMPEPLKLVQLAQFVECISGSNPDREGRNAFNQEGFSSGSAAHESR